MADRHIGFGHPFATAAAAYAASGAGDTLIYHATAGAPTNFDEPHTHMLLDWLTIKPAPGDEGLITVRPNGALTQIWTIESDTSLFQGLKFDLGGGTVGWYLTIQACNDGVIDDCDFAVATGDYGIRRGVGVADGWVAQGCTFTCTGTGHGIYPGNVLINFTAKDSTFLLESGHGLYNFYETTHLAERCRFIGDGVNPGKGITTLRRGTVRNCIFAGLSYGIDEDRFCTTGGVLNNTFYNCVRGVQLGPDDGFNVLDNNAFVNCGTGIFGGGVGHIPPPNAPSNNLFFDNGVDSALYTAAVNSQFGDPQFIDAPNNDFTFLLGSPLIDNGRNLAGIVDDDIVKTPRPQGAGWDIGAHELLPWLTVVRPYVYNRARAIVTGVCTSWVSTNGPDPTMSVHPAAPNSADYEDFVVLKAD